MAEGTRRSKVTPFVHNTDYVPTPKPFQRRFLDAALDDHVWSCAPATNAVPPDGTQVLVRVGKNKELQVLWGNQVVANVTDALRNELVTAICNRDQASVMVATAISNDADGGNPFNVRFAQAAG